MIPILYDGSETEFTSNGLGRLRDCLTCEVTEERNGIFECDFTYPVDGANFELIQVGRIIGVMHDDNGDIQPFDIVSYTKPIDGIVTFHAVHISYRQSGLTIALGGYNTLELIFYSLKNLSEPPYSNPFNYSTDITTTAFVAAADGQTPRTVRQWLGGIEGSILDSFGGEYKFDKWDVKLLRRRGVDLDFTIRYGVNLLEYTEETDAQSVYNACIPFWKGTDEAGDELVVKGSLAKSELPTPGGRVVCVPLDLTDKFEERPTPTDLTNYAVSIMKSKQTNVPAQTIKVDFIRLQDSEEYAGYRGLLQCSLCDTINVVFPEYNMQGRYKIVKTTYDVLQEKYTDMELGTLSTTLAEALGISNTLDRSGGSGGGGGGSVTDVFINGASVVNEDGIAEITNAAGDFSIAGDLTVGGHTTPVGTVNSFTRTSTTTVGTTVVTLGSITLPPGSWVARGWVRFPAGTTGYRRIWVTNNNAITGTQTGTCTAIDSALQVVVQNVGLFSSEESRTLYLRAQASTSLTVTAADCGLSIMRIA